MIMKRIMTASVTNAAASVTHPAACVTQTAASVTQAATFNCSVFTKIAVLLTRKQPLSQDESNTCEIHPRGEGGVPLPHFSQRSLSPPDLRTQRGCQETGVLTHLAIGSNLTSIVAEGTIQGSHAEYRFFPQFRMPDVRSATSARM